MSALADKIESCCFPSYVYTYPPTRAFRPTDEFSLWEAVFTDPINLYIHIPFCNQKCTFCGYLTYIDRKQELFDRYVDCIIAEMRMYAQTLRYRTIESVNFGGGTPSLLSIAHFERIMTALLEINPRLMETAKEISIEATPESIYEHKIHALKKMGFNRVSIGIQSFDDTEIAQSGRHNSEATTRTALDALMGIEMPNVCCDLMYGLRGQTVDTWYDSLRNLLHYRPQTIELYATVTIPGTPLARTTSDVMSPADKYYCYEYAREALLSAGYVHDCHLRFVLPGTGFYQQQKNVFAGQSLIGLGVGARTYACNMHYRNEYDARDSARALMRYMEAIETDRLAVTSKVILRREEVLRRDVIYGIELLDEAGFLAKHQIDVNDVFGEELAELAALELIERRDSVITMTPRGLKYRDLIANRFFSPEVAADEEDYWRK